MVRFAQVQPGAKVQLGRMYGPRSQFSHMEGEVVEKLVTKINNSVWSAIVVRTSPRKKVMVQIHNIKAITG